MCEPEQRRAEELGAQIIRMQARMFWLEHEHQEEIKDYKRRNRRWKTMAKRKNLALRLQFDLFVRFMQKLTKPTEIMEKSE